MARNVFCRQRPVNLPCGEELQNRMVYPPLTRCRAFDTIPQPWMAEYYGQRATPGTLLITEATIVDRDGQGCQRELAYPPEM
eukprot:460519-Pelagomonas_calceolata.AAC.3